MKIDMWILADQLSDLEPVADISGAAPAVSGLRVYMDTDPPEAGDGYVYLCPGHDGVSLKSGASSVYLPGAGTEAALNSVLEIFEDLRKWDDELRKLAAEHSLQGLIDCGSRFLENPMILSDASGRVLAMSSEFRAEDINLYWCTARDEGQIPLEVLGAPMYDEEGALRSWGDEPTLFHTQDGDNLIGSYLTVDGIRHAGLGLWEHRRGIRRGDLALFNMLCDAVIASMEHSDEERLGRSMADILCDILDEKKIDTNLLARMDTGCRRPWQLVLISNPFRSDSIYKESLLYYLKNYQQPNISFVYENRVVIFASAEDVPEITGISSGKKGKDNYQTVVSVPFDDLSDMPVRYRQCVYTVEQTGGQPGVYNSGDHCFEYLLSRFTQLNKAQALSHPALSVLRQHDLEKNTEYYRTLFVYLLYERSILLGSQKLHIHKNSFLYRIQKIRDMIDVDLDDPEQRGYLLLSYYMEGER